VKTVKKEAILLFLKEQSDWTLDRLQALLDRLHGSIGWQIQANRYLKANYRPKQLENLFFVKEPEFKFQFY
jgi:hypothetical protein